MREFLLRVVFHPSRKSVYQNSDLEERYCKAFLTSLTAHGIFREGSVGPVGRSELWGSSVEEREIVASVLQEVLDALPPPLREKLENVEFVVRDEAERGLGFVLGLYQGVPLPRRGLGYTFVLPDRIVLYLGNIRRIAPREEEFRRKVREVLLHEIGHYFGFGEEDLQRLLGEGG